jgi:hypothetical protein
MVPATDDFSDVTLDPGEVVIDRGYSLILITRARHKLPFASAGAASTPKAFGRLRHPPSPDHWQPRSDCSHQSRIIRWLLRLPATPLVRRAGQSGRNRPPRSAQTGRHQGHICRCRENECAAETSFLVPSVSPKLASIGKSLGPSRVRLRIPGQSQGHIKTGTNQLKNFQGGSKDQGQIQG